MAIDPAYSPISEAGARESRLSTAKNFRTDLGFPSDPQLIEKLEDTPGLNRKYGVPLFPTEVAEIQRRQAMLDLSDKIKAALEPAKSFADIWMDNEAGGILTVAVTGDAQSAAKLVTGAVPLDVNGKIKVISVPLPATTLTETLEKISEEAPAEWELQAVEKDVLTGTISVTVSENAPSDVEATIPAKYGSNVTVTRGLSGVYLAVNRTFQGTNGEPLYGGTRISRQAGGSCTIGHSNIRDSVGRFLTLTAGHCGNRNEGFAQGNTSGRYVGAMTADGVPAGTTTTDCDCAVIGNIPGGSGTQSWYLNDNSLERFTGIGASGKGGVVCQSGVTTMEKRAGTNYPTYYGPGVVQCGVIENVNDPVIIPGAYTVREVILSKMTCLQGDSGGPGGNNAKINGIVSFGANTPYSSEARCGMSSIYNLDTIGVTIGF